MQKQFEVSTIFRIFVATILIAIAVIAGASSASGYFDIFSIMIVFGGTIFVTIACFSITDFFHAFATSTQTLLFIPKRSKSFASLVVKLAEVSKKEGLLALQKYEDKIPDNIFFNKYLTLIIDGLPAADAERYMMQEIESIQIRHRRAVEVLSKAAETAPAMGLIGTLVGLVQMLGNLEDVSKIGPAMAVALLTTFYGAVLSYVILSPLASKLEKNSKEEIEQLMLCAEAVSSIARSESPMKLELKLNSILSPDQRIKLFS